jgi:hypothetical protein
LTARCIDILHAAKKPGTSDYIFPGQRPNKPLSSMSMPMAIRRLGINATVHGFRSAFRNWAAEQTHYPRDVCEMALAHGIKDKTEAADRRGDLLEKRRELMDARATFAASMPVQNVVRLRRSRPKVQASH